MPTQQALGPRNKLQVWMDKATADEKRELATLTGTSIGTLRQIAGAYRTDGALSVSSELAARIETGTAAMRAANGKLPIVLRTHLSRACAACSIAKVHFAANKR